MTRHRRRPPGRTQAPRNTATGRADSRDCARRAAETTAAETTAAETTATETTAAGSPGAGRRLTVVRIRSDRPCCSVGLEWGIAFAAKRWWACNQGKDR
jgi:hypothetical protein